MAANNSGKYGLVNNIPTVPSSLDDNHVLRFPSKSKPHSIIHLHHFTLVIVVHTTIKHYLPLLSRTLIEIEDWNGKLILTCS